MDKMCLGQNFAWFQPPENWLRGDFFHDHCTIVMTIITIGQATEIREAWTQNIAKNEKIPSLKDEKIFSRA